MDKLVEVKNLKHYYPAKGPRINGEKPVVKAIDDISFHISAGETFALVGESGCGKTTVGRAVLRLIEPTGGEVFFEGDNLLKLSSADMRARRKDMQMVFQDPFGCLNPRETVGDIIARPLRLHKFGSRAAIHDKVRELMETVGLDPGYANRYPHEFSGGQRQRVGFARAVALTPKFIVCDEPVSALDVSIQAQIVNLMRRLQQKFNLTYLFISHDLRVVHHISGRVAVMYLGRIMETARKEDLYREPAHPYTKALLAAAPRAERTRGADHLHPLAGDLPTPFDIPSGCRFHTRCPECRDICVESEPPEINVGEGHVSRCHFAKADIE